jgi:mannose-6-phosphate isomerase class I
MRDHFDLPKGPPNYAWCFDCVPEENSVLFRFGDRTIESPALGIVQRHPEELLGTLIYQRFGAEFPIRFDFLDTVGGGNLSLQVHPLASYMQSTFGMAYTQDESYYILDAEPDALVYLGVRNDIDPRQMGEDLRAAQTAGGAAFDAGKHVQAWPARKHDHFSIPAGTVHCSGRNALVLEVSATPYIFTFKLWDWDRMGLDGRARPIHLDHGLKNIQWNRTKDWVAENLVNPIRRIADGNGWYEEATGLHELEFLETRRHWFTEQVPHDTQGNLNVLNLVQGTAVIVASPSGAFEDFTVHYAETFIVPAAVGAYTIRPLTPTSTAFATLKAYVRGEAR